MPLNSVPPRRIYLASSWRNLSQPGVVEWLRGLGHKVYDFRNPAPDVNGFAWSEIDPDWLKWTPSQFTEVLLNSPIAKRGYGHDKDALDWCDTCVLLLPCGRSAHLEAGYAIGQRKRTAILLNEDGFEPELMYLLADLVTPSRSELQMWLAQGREPEPWPDLDTFDAWRSACVVDDPEGALPATILLGSFNAYCRRFGFGFAQRRTFGALAADRWIKAKSAGQVVYRGVRLIPTGGEAAPPTPARDTHVLDGEAAS